MEERMNFGVLASCLHGRACLRDEVNRSRKSHGVNYRGAREGTPSDIFFAPSRRCLIITRPSSPKTRTRKVQHAVTTRKPHQLISMPAICLFSDTMKTSERWRCTCCHESQKPTWAVRALRRGLTTMTAIKMENVHNQVLEFIWERDSRWPEKWEKQRREELWTAIPSSQWILNLSDFCGMIFTVQHEKEDTHQCLGQPHHHRCNGRRMDRCYASPGPNKICGPDQLMSFKRSTMLWSFGDCWTYKGPCKRKGWDNT